LRTDSRHIVLIVLFAVLLHLPIFTGLIKPVPANFTWWAPWDEDAVSDTAKGACFDYLTEYLPWQKYLNDSVRDGHLPLWNNYQFCGTPFMANHLLSPFYPPIAISLFASYEFANSIVSLLHFLIGPIFMYLYLRRMNIGGKAALVGTFAFCSTGMFIPLFPPWPAAMVWLPAVLYFIEGWLSGARGWRDVPWLSFAIGFWLMEAYPVFVVHSIYFAFFYILCVGPAGRRLVPAVMFISSLILGTLISAAQNLPTLFFFLESTRFKPDADSMLALLLSVPNFLNHFMPSQSGAFIIGYKYIGLIPFLFLPFAFLRLGGRARYNLFWLIASLAISLIPRLLMVLYKILPGWEITAHPPTVPLFFSLAVLAALGADYLWSHRERNRQHMKIAMSVAAAIFIVVLFFNITGGRLNRTIIFYSLGCAALLLFIFVSTLSGTQATWCRRASLGAIAAILILTALPWWMNLRHNRPLEEVFDTPIYQDYIKDFSSTNLRLYRKGWQQNVPPNMGILWGIEDAGGYDSLVLKNYYDAALLHGIHFHRGRETMPITTTYPVDPGMLEDMGIGILLTSPYTNGLRTNGWVELETTPHGVGLSVKKSVWRAALIPEGKFMADAIPLDYHVEGPNEVRITITQPLEAGYVVIRDTYASGWKAWVDSEPVDIEQYREWMRQINVDAGAKEIVMKYEPVEFKVGLLISIIAAFIALVWIAGGHRRKALKKSDVA